MPHLLSKISLQTQAKKTHKKSELRTMLELGTGIWIILCSSKNSFAQKQKKMKNIMKQKQKISNITKQTKPLKLLYMKSLAFHQTHRK